MLNKQQFLPSDSAWTFRNAPQDINSAIDSYPVHITSTSAGETQAPYDAASLAEIHAPDVRKLMDLQSRGFTHASWGRLEDDGRNRWFGVAHDTPAVGNKNTGLTPHQSRERLKPGLN